MFWAYAVMLLLMFISFLLIVIVLLQKGRGGGLAGAFGGAGGQSAFGTRAGDVFTKITVGMAVVWVVLAGSASFVLRDAVGGYQGGSEVAPEETTLTSGEDGTETETPAVDENPFESPAPSTGTAPEMPAEGEATPPASTEENGTAPALPELPSVPADSSEADTPASGDAAPRTESSEPTSSEASPAPADESDAGSQSEAATTDNK